MPKKRVPSVWKKRLENVLIIAGVAIAVYLVVTITGCAPLQWAVTQDPITGMVPALSALPQTVDGGLSGLLSGGVFGLLAFIGTYGKSIRRMYLERGKKKK